MIATIWLSLAAAAAPQELSSLELQGGWRILFDGSSVEGWRGYGQAGFPDEGWELQDGNLVCEGTAGIDLVTTDTFENFELELEWSAEAGVNSGIKYRVRETPEASRMLGPEFQILLAGESPKRSTGALYDVFASQGGGELPSGRFHHTRIVADEGWVEHWLNGEHVLSCEIGSEEWEEAKAASKFAAIADFALGPGHVGLQDHGGRVRFRNIRIRDLDELPGAEIDLFPGGRLEGWRVLGDARYAGAAGTVLGVTGLGGSQSFLASEPRFGDFLLEVDVRTEQPGNSGIQLRSRETANGRLQGYQIEIDPSERAWSGGLYDEARRGWLQTLEDNPAGRQAFRHQEWNRFRIECLGPWIRAWVNGIPTTDFLDAEDLSGVLGLQVHAGHNTELMWRNFRLRDLGTRRWIPMPVEDHERFWRIGHGRLHAEEDVLIAVPETGWVSWSSFSLRTDYAVRFEYRLVDAKLTASVHGITVDIPSPPDQEWHRLAVMTYGDRVAVQLDGKTIFDTIRGGDRPEAPLGLRVGNSDAARAYFRAWERLSDPRQSF